MKRGLWIATAVLAIASYASGAEVLFFLASPASSNAATSGAGALGAGLNPSIDTSGGPGCATLELWMYLDSAEMMAGSGAGGTYGVTGGGLDVTGGGTHSIALTVNNPGGRWAGTANAPAGADYNGMGFLNIGSPVGPGAADDDGSFVGLFRIASGDICWTLGEESDVFVEIPAGGAIGGSNSDGTAVGGIGFTAGPLAGGGAPDQTSPHPDLDTAYGTGFYLASPGGAIRSLVPDLRLVPEPTTLALLGLAGLLVRRRR